MGGSPLRGDYKEPLSPALSRGEREAEDPGIRGTSSQVWGDAERSYNLGLSARGQAALRELGCMEDVGMHTTGVNPPRAPARIDGKPAAA